MDECLTLLSFSPLPSRKSVDRVLYVQKSVDHVLRAQKSVDLVLFGQKSVDCRSYVCRNLLITC